MHGANMKRADGEVSQEIVKQGGVCEMTRKNWNNPHIQKKLDAF